MITKPLVIVLGAGASMPYGFPSGRSLLFEICNNLDKANSKFKELLYHTGFKPGSLHSFAYELRNSMQPSVDAFLEKRPEYLELGKAAITAALIPYENKDTLKRTAQDYHWYEYLFSKLEANSIDEFIKNKVSFLTFNYDRSLEYFLFNAIKYTYSLPDEVAASKVNQIPIIHLHGQLGTLPHFGKNELEFGYTHKEQLNPEIIKKIMYDIKIIFELKDELPNEFSRANEILNKSQRICLLGFGYHPTNISRLMNNFKGNPFNPNRIVGTAYEIESGERPQIERLFKKFNNTGIKLGDSRFKILEFLKKTVVFE